MCTSWKSNYNDAEYLVHNNGGSPGPAEPARVEGEDGAEDEGEDALVYGLLKSCELRGLWPSMRDERCLAAALAAQLAGRPPRAARRVLDAVLQQAALAADLRLSTVLVVPLSALAVLGLLGQCAAPARRRRVVLAVAAAVATVADARDPHPATLAAAGRALAAAAPGRQPRGRGPLQLRRRCPLRGRGWGGSGVRRLALALAHAAHPHLHPDTPPTARADMLAGLAALLGDAGPEVGGRLLDAEVAEAAASAALGHLRDGGGPALALALAPAPAVAAATRLLARMSGGALGERHRVKQALVSAARHYAP